MSRDADQPHPPYELHSERLVVRCWQPSDAARLKDAVDSSLEHLREWMPWAHDEPTTVEQKVLLLRGFRGRFDLGTDFIYGIFDSAQARVLGGCGLHPRSGPRSLEIGYWVRADAVRQGIATEVVQLLSRAAFECCRIERLDVLVDPDNAASLAIPRQLGFSEDGRLRRRLGGREDEPLRDAIAFSMTDDEYASSQLRSPPLRAFDCAGNPIELA